MVGASARRRSGEIRGFNPADWTSERHVVGEALAGGGSPPKSVVGYPTVVEFMIVVRLPGQPSPGLRTYRAPVQSSRQMEYSIRRSPAMRPSPMNRLLVSHV